MNMSKSRVAIVTGGASGIGFAIAEKFVQNNIQTIVIGHRNPDMDSICSAVAYAELKRKLGMNDVIAARAGNTNERIDFVLNKFGVPAPDFVSDLTPTVADVMETKVVSVERRGRNVKYLVLNEIEPFLTSMMTILTYFKGQVLRAGFQ